VALGGIVYNQLKNGILQSLSVKICFKSVNIWQSYEQKRDCLVHFLRLLVCLPGAQRGLCSRIDKAQIYNALLLEFVGVRTIYVGVLYSNFFNGKHTLIFADSL